jgi:hypothetical protein
MSPSPRDRSCSRWSRENTGTKFPSTPPSQHGRISSVPWFLSCQWKERRVHVKTRLLNYQTGRESALKLQVRGRHLRSRRLRCDPERRPLDCRCVQRKKDKGAEVDALELCRTVSPNETTPLSPAHNCQLSSTPAQTRVCGDKPFSAVRYDGMVLPFACGSASMDEEHLKVVSIFSVESW